LKLHCENFAGDKGAPGYSGLAGEDGGKVSTKTIFYKIMYVLHY